MGDAEADDELVKQENLNSTSKVTEKLQSPPANQSCCSSIGPVTPDREVGGEQQHHHELSSPLTDNNNDSSSETPKETLFDSFAPPGTDDKLMLAPHHNKYKFIREEGSRVNVVRRLDFKDVATIIHREESTISTEQEEEEEQMFQIVYGALVDAIVSEQQQQQTEQQKQPGDESPRTPPKSFIIDIVETPCPGAPIKSTTKYSRMNFLDKEICKKLEF